MSKSLAMLPVLWWLVLLTSPAGGLEERWGVEIVSSARSLPLVVDVDGDGRSETLVTTRFDGSLWNLASDGAVLGRARRDHWLEGSVAAAFHAGSTTPLLAFQESTGLVNLVDYGRGLDVRQDVPGQPCIGSAPCIADLDADGVPEVVCARMNGVVTVLDATAAPRWQFDCGSSFHASPACAPVFGNSAALYVQSIDGALFCLAGSGEPLWRFETANPGATFPSVADPLAVHLAGEDFVVLVSDREGWLYAVDAVSGAEMWRERVGSCALGSPAVFAESPEGPRRLIVVSEKGELAILTTAGGIVNRHALPEGRYVPRPVVADVDADGQAEIVVPAHDWKLVIAGLDATVEETIGIRGNVREGVVLADVDSDGALELIAATECARAYCYATRATRGWTHPRGGRAMSGYVGPAASVLSASAPDRPRYPAQTGVGSGRRFRVDEAAASEYAKDSLFATAVVSFRRPRKADRALVSIRRDGELVGSAWRQVSNGRVAVPCVRRVPGNLAIDVRLCDVNGALIGTARAVAPGARSPRPVRLASRESFVEAMGKCADAFETPRQWDLPRVAGRDSWHVVRHMPDAWRTYGLADEPFIKDAIPRIWAPAVGGPLFGPSHEAWPDIHRDTKPFFVMNNYFRPKEAYPESAYEAIRAMAGPRFLGFPVHEWAYRVWKQELEPGERPVVSRTHATEVLREDFEYLLDVCHGDMYPGQGYCLFHHQAFAWGGPLAYAETGENIPCAPLQFAFLRGASRQYGGRPWGAYLSNWFRSTVVDTRWRPGEPTVRWGVPDIGTGPTCGHSASLEFRMHMAAHLAGATFVHHESDAHHGSIFMKEREDGSYALSPYGRAIKAWHTYSNAYPDRGVPYTPIAFLLDFDHGWRPRESIYGIWPQTRPDHSIENVFRHVFPWGGRLDFERGYLANGPYGDIFDVITDDASQSVLDSYGVIWPLGDLTLTDRARRALVDYVTRGGILVVDSPVGSAFPTKFLGTRLRAEWSLASQIQTALQSVPRPSAPYRYRHFRPLKDSEVLAWTEHGDPLLVWRRVGRGVVVVGATSHWLDEEGCLLPIVPALLGPLAKAFLPLRPSTDVQMLLNRTSRGWIVGLINNNGVTKTPTEPPVSHKSGVRDCVLYFDGQAPAKFVSRLGEFRWSLRAGGLRTRLQPGQVSIVELTYGGEGSG